MKNLGENKGCEFFFGANKEYEKKVKGCENFRGKFKGYEKLSPFSEKHSNRVSRLKKDRPLRFWI